VSHSRPGALAAESVRTLRHYDDLGLLKPARVDPLTGYRHYTGRWSSARGLTLNSRIIRAAS
jgi:hypothetical protein